MKRITFTVTVVILAASACKKEKNAGQKCAWNVILNNQVAYEWLEEPSSDQIQKIEDSCACTIKVNEVCFSCNTTVTTAGGIDVECK